MPRGRKPKVDLLLAPKEETKKVKSPWDKTKESTEEKTEIEFSQFIIERNRKQKKESIATISKGYGYKNLPTVALLKEQLKKLKEEALVYWEQAYTEDSISLYIEINETDEEVISRLRQKKLELEKLREELSDENT